MDPDAPDGPEGPVGPAGPDGPAGPAGPGGPEGPEGPGAGTTTVEGGGGAEEGSGCEGSGEGCLEGLGHGGRPFLYVMVEAAVRCCRLPGRAVSGALTALFASTVPTSSFPLVDWRKRVCRFRELKMVPQFVGRKGVLLETTVNVS